MVFVLAAAPGGSAVATVAGLTGAALVRGHQTRAFLVGDGVLSASAIAQSGAETVVCDADWRWRRGGDPMDPGVTRGSLRDLAIWCQEADKVLVFS